MVHRALTAPSERFLRILIEELRGRVSGVAAAGAAIVLPIRNGQTNTRRAYSNTLMRRNSRHGGRAQ